VPLGTPIGRSWLLLFGIIPFDYDKITIAERDHGRRFLEKSTMMSMARWEHERCLEERDRGCLVKDRTVARPPVLHRRREVATGPSTASSRPDPARCS
jgi:hypothetical protein